MKNLFLFLLLITFSENVIFAQSTVADNKYCPSFSIKEFDETGSKGIISFDVEFENGFDSSNLSYKWTFSEGEIIGSRETKAITIKETHSCILDVTVEIKGLSKECPNTKSYRVNFCPEPILILVGEYEKLSKQEENFWLDKLSVELQNNPHAYGFIVRLFPSEISRVTIYQDLQRILNYLQTKGSDTSRIVFNLGNNATYQTKIFIIPPGVEQPSEWGNELLYANTLASKLKSNKTSSRKKQRGKN